MPTRTEQRAKLQAAANGEILCHELTGKDDHPTRDASKNTPMSESEKIRHWNEARADGTLSADYRMSIAAFSPMMRKESILVDCGGNGGRFAEFALKSRPDLKAIVIEPDPKMYALAQEALKDEIKAGRVTLIDKPVPDALAQIANGPDAKHVSMISSMYRSHLQTDAQNGADLKAMNQLIATSGASIGMLDLHRAKSKHTSELMPKVYPADSASHEFREGYRVALSQTAYRGPELESLVERHTGKAGWEHHVAGTLGQLQLHIKQGTHIPDKGKAPTPNYPPMQEEYIEVARQIELALGLKKVPSKADILGTGPMLKTAASCLGDTATERLSVLVEKAGQAMSNISFTQVSNGYLGDLVKALTPDDNVASARTNDNPKGPRTR